MNDKESLLQFPCDFSIKVFGAYNEQFVSEISAIAQSHFPDIKDSAIKLQPSKQGNYLAITLTVFAQNQASLDKLYQELTSHPDTKMVL